MWAGNQDKDPLEDWKKKKVSGKNPRIQSIVILGVLMGVLIKLIVYLLK